MKQMAALVSSKLTTSMSSTFTHPHRFDHDHTWQQHVSWFRSRVRHNVQIAACAIPATFTPHQYTLNTIRPTLFTMARKFFVGKALPFKLRLCISEC